MSNGINFEKMSRSKNRVDNHIKEEWGEYEDNNKYLYSFYETILTKSDLELLADDDYSLNNFEGWFDPQKEIKKISQLKSGNEKTKALAVFKFRFVEQQKGLARLKEEIINTANQEDENLEDELKRIIIKYKLKYKFSEKQLNKINQMTYKFLYRHEEVNEFCENYKNDPIEMYRQIFGVDPVGQIKVKKGLISIAFICYDINDYARLYSGDFSSEYSLTENDIKAANKSGGVFINRQPRFHRGLRHTIIGVNHFSDNYDEKAIKHEEQHSINSLYLDVDNSIIGDLYYSLYTSISAESDKRIVTSYCKNIVAAAYERAKDEIIAYSVQASRDKEEVLEILLKSKDEGGLYDYVNRSDIFNEAKKSFNNNVAELNEVIKKITIDDYKKTISDGLEAVGILRQKGYSDQAMTEILMSRPLDQWLKVANRVLLVNKSLR